MIRGTVCSMDDYYIKASDFGGNVYFIFLQMLLFRKLCDAKTQTSFQFTWNTCQVHETGVPSVTICFIAHPQFQIVCTSIHVYFAPIFRLSLSHLLWNWCFPQIFGSLICTSTSWTFLLYRPPAVNSYLSRSPPLFRALCSSSVGGRSMPTLLGKKQKISKNHLFLYIKCS